MIYYSWNLPWIRRDCDSHSFEFHSQTPLPVETCPESEGIATNKTASSFHLLMVLFCWNLPWIRRDCDFFHSQLQHHTLFWKLKPALNQKGLRPSIKSKSPVSESINKKLKPALNQKGLRLFFTSLIFAPPLLSFLLKPALNQKGLRLGGGGFSLFALYKRWNLPWIRRDCDPISWSSPVNEVLTGLKPALNQKGLRHTFGTGTLSSTLRLIIVETCPESEGIATKGRVRISPPHFFYVETCPESEGIATYPIGKSDIFKLLFVETCPESEGIATVMSDGNLLSRILILLKPALNQKGLRRGDYPAPSP